MAGDRLFFLLLWQMLNIDASVLYLRESYDASGFAAAILAILFIKPPAKPVRNVTTTTPPPEVIEEEELMPYRAGVGIADMTGPITEISFMGFANGDQKGGGIHTRQWSRAFIIETDQTTFVLVSAEINIVGIALRREVVRNLQKMYGNKYTLRNVFIGATGTFSTPGGYLGDFLLDGNINGFSNEVFYAYCDGITESIVRAQGNMKGARMYYGRTRVWNVAINRAPYAYLSNPMEERARYDSDVDNLLSQIRIVNASGGIIGVMNWFAVHANSLNGSNNLVSSDNLGYAAIQLEKALNPDNKTGEGPIVGAFFVGNAGDVSPNVYGAKCSLDGSECDNWTLKCKSPQYCIPMGPSAEDYIMSAKMIGSGIYEGAMRILYVPREVAFELTGQLNIVHTYLQPEEEVGDYFNPIDRVWEWVITSQQDMEIVPYKVSSFASDREYADLDWNNRRNKACKPAIGMNVIGGTMDGQAGLFKRADRSPTGSLLWENVDKILQKPSDGDIRCHKPKNIMFITGWARYPVPFHHRASVFIVNMGGIYLAGVGAELTTMAGRRIRYIVSNYAGTDQLYVIVMGNVNEYIHYLTTRHEYNVQSFEAASTLHGKKSLEICMYKLIDMARKASNGDNSFSGVEQQYFKDQALSLVFPAIADQAPENKTFGQVLVQPKKKVATETTVKATFVGANPRNDLMTGKTHLKVEGLIDGKWTEVATDANWETKLIWERIEPISPKFKGLSNVTISWDVPAEADYTYYRLKYIGASRDQFGQLTPFEGVTAKFTVSDEEGEEEPEEPEEPENQNPYNPQNQGNQRPPW